MEYQKKNQLITVTDTVKSAENNDYTFLWHLAPDIEPHLNRGDNTITLKRNDKVVMQMDIDSTTDILIDIVKGQVEPQIMGWYFKGIQDPVPTHTLLIELSGHEVQLSTHFNLK